MSRSLPTKDRLVEILGQEGDFLHPREIAERLSLEEGQFDGLLRILDDMVFNGVVTARGKKFKLDARAQKIASGSEKKALQGVVTVNPRGFGFVKLDAESGKASKESGDVFIPEENLGGAMHGDTVEVRVVSRSARGMEGRIERIVTRGRLRVVGTLRRRRDQAWVEPDDTRVRGPITLSAKMDQQGGEGNSGNDGDAVIIRITRFPEFDGEHPEGTLEAVLGRPGELSVEVRKLLAMSEIREVHGEGAVRMAESFGFEVPAAMLEGRVDLTAVPLPTIDPEDARDHDDAVWVDRTREGGYLAHIAIADVASYVTPDTPLDDEAKARGCSLYLPDRAIPMLPRALSSNLCSLLPNVIRLCLCCKVTLDSEGKVLAVELIRGYMNSRAKLTYGGVARTLGLTEDGDKVPEAEAMKDGLAVAYELSRALRARRRERGALDFDLPEAKFTLNAEGKPEAIEKRGSDPGVRRAYELIEELMILANECVARWLIERNVPTVFRVHAPPDATKIDKLASMCEHLGIPFDPEETKSPRALSGLLTRFSQHELSHVLNNLLLRSMKQAIYDVDNIGHFGLASEAYAHFTSPIRRYPDVTVHRQVHRLIEKSGEKVERATMKEAADASSLNERRAMEVERDIADLYKCFYMRDRVNEKFTATVSAVTGGGLFLTIDSPFVDVFIKYEDLGDDFSPDDDGLRASSGSESIQLGDAIEVQITDVSVTRRTTYARRVGAVRRDGAARKPRLPRADSPQRGPGDRNAPQKSGRSGGAGSFKGKKKKGGKPSKAGPGFPERAGKPSGGGSGKSSSGGGKFGGGGQASGGKPVKTGNKNKKRR